MLNRRKFLLLLSSTFAWLLTPGKGQNDLYGKGDGGGRGRKREPDNNSLPPELGAFALLSLVMGCISDRSVTVSALSKEPMEGYFEYGVAPGEYRYKTDLVTLPAGQPVEAVFGNLHADTEYFYRFHHRKPGAAAFEARQENRFHTQRAPGSSFSFGIQGDSHPERPQMHAPGLYARTLLDAASLRPDFYICMGDDFSVDTLWSYDETSVSERYTLQRPFLGLVAQSAPLFLLNGNHEQASLYNYNRSGEAHDIAVSAQNARNRYFPTPAPDGFYSGNTETLKSIGLLKDYYAWTWGDALFVVLDCYWHSLAPVDSQLHEKGGGNMDHASQRNRDWWGITIGDAQYHWFKKTLEENKAKFKFVFAHHVLGTGRGGVEEADLYEWGGRNKRGDWGFKEERPGWEMPIHQLMVKHGVTIFFQGHDHLFARQERDGIVYQEVPMPADQFYEARNEDRYLSGVKLPNSGHLRVTVAPEQVKVEYVRSFLPKDETNGQKSGQVAHSYTVNGKESHA